MKAIKKVDNLHLRISEQEKDKYATVANEVGLSLSAFARYSMARTSKRLNHIENEL